MRTRILGAALVLLPLKLFAQGLVVDGATLNITSGTPLVVSGNLVNNTGSTINNDGQLSVNGSVTNNATMSSAGNGALIFNGTTAQTVSGSSAYLAENVTVNNPSGITLSTPLRVDGAITFTSGIVTSGSASAPLVFTSNGSVAATPTNASHVSGYVTKEGTGAFTFPVGNGTNYQPVGVTLAANSAGFSARYIAGAAGTAPYSSAGASPVLLQFTNQREYWDMAPVGAGTASGTVTIFWDNVNNVGIGNTADLRVAHLVGGSWRNEGAAGVTGTTASGTVTSGTVSTWSPFTLGSISATSPLPIQLLDFAAVPEKLSNRISWEVAKEESGTSYVAERSRDGRSFMRIGGLPAAGQRSYQLYDNHPWPGKSYYRLVIEEPGQTPVYSPIAAVDRPDGATGIAVTPVPASDVITLTCLNASLTGRQMTISDIAGKIMYSAAIQDVSRIRISEWPAGTYQLHVGGQPVQRFVKE